MQNLSSHYSRFRVTERVLLTGHSHQAWPDVAFEAQQRAWLDAAELVDDKWDRAAEAAEDVRGGWRRLLNDPDGDIALGQNTHDLVVRLLSAVLPLFGAANHLRQGYGGREAARRHTRSGAAFLSAGASAKAEAAPRTKVVTTDGEFHTIRRQVDRLAEEGVDVVKIAARPAESLAERLAAAIDDRTACVLVSSVLFETAEIVPDLAAVARACERHGVTLLVDAYHHLNVIPFDIETLGLARAFVVGGGYKYCQLGEGNGFLRIPRDCELRPVITGWFSEFDDIADRTAFAKATAVKKVRATCARPGEVRYGRAAARFAGATYDPTPHYRARAVFAFHQEMQLTPDRLRQISRDQVGLLLQQFEALDLEPAIAKAEPMPAERRGGFLAIRTRRAREVVTALRQRGVFSDARGDVLRLGPAPYLADQQLRDGIAALADALSAPVDPSF